MGKVFTVAMHKGGVGKTSLLTNIVGALNVTEPSKKILILDTDGQANSAMAFGLSTKKFETGTHNLFMQNKNIKECIYNISENIDLIPATDEMDFIEFDVLMDKDLRKEPFSLLDKAIEEIKDSYDYIFVDTPPSLSLIMGNALKIADEVIIPFQPEPFGVRGIKKIIETIAELGQAFEKKVKILGVVGMLVDRRTELHSVLLADARKFCDKNDIKMFETVIPKSIRFANATAFEGKPATMIEKRHELIDAYYSLLEEILEEVKVGVTNG
ncbi:ParA family protein [Priestia megaterium]|uniref:ParA family protein n=1 Tax=Priestia megaterium TaxID=1404 RepID=UPI000BF2BE09|nr:ParA family protein [Priestia megaterium]PFW43822.1 chromosome partitioning protein ParA [Priestia megaterium]